MLPNNAPVPGPVRVAQWLYRLRVPIYGMAVVSLILVACGIGYATVLGASLLRQSFVSVTQSAPAPTPDSGTALAADLPQYAPDQIWLVEKTDEFEVYSNGARVLTEFEVDGDPRQFYSWPVQSETPTDGIEHSGHPIGIVFHTSQSHIAPFKAEYNQKLQTSSRALLDYVRKHGLYNYVIDRFGRIYRIVKDDCRADHAGNSVWADSESLYLDVSDGFLGICFEAQWSPDTQLAPDQINEAQIYAGRVLTAMLRSKYQISEENCVTHAAVSVSPASRLIGFHMDWARAFPFASIGVSNKYETEIPAISLFGFGHDGAFDSAVGHMWPGIEKSDARLRDMAETRQLTASQLRNQLQDKYRAFKSWVSKRQVHGVGDGG